MKGTVLSLLTGGGGNENYFHWMYDVLPRFALCEKTSDLNKVDFFLLPDTIKKFQQESLDILNISKEKLISSKFFRHISCSELLVTDHPYVITNDASNDIQNIPLWISEWLKKKYISNKCFLKQSKIWINFINSTPLGLIYYRLSEDLQQCDGFSLPKEKNCNKISKLCDILNIKDKRSF